MQDNESDMRDAFSASAAYDLSRRKAKAGNKNFSLTIKRLYRIIEVAATQGHDNVTFVTPRFIQDGCLADPILLAKQLKWRLTKLGYTVDRTEEKLVIKWGEADKTAK